MVDIPKGKSGIRAAIESKCSKDGSPERLNLFVRELFL